MARVLDFKLFRGEAQNPFVDTRLRLFEYPITHAIIRYSRTDGVTCEADFVNAGDAMAASDGVRPTYENKPWFFYVTYSIEGNNPRTQYACLFVGRALNRRTYARRDADTKNRVLFGDYLVYARDRSVAPATDIAPNVYTGTSLAEEFKRFGIEARGIPRIEIPRIEYTPDATVWSVLAPYVEQFEPLVISASFAGANSGLGFYLDEEDGFTYLADGGANGGEYVLSSILDVALSTSAGGLTLGIDYTNIEESSAQVDGQRVNLVKFIKGQPPAEGLDPSVEYEERREAGEPSVGSDGRTIIPGEVFWDLREDEENPDVVTRSVFMGQYSDTYDAPGEDQALGQLMASSETLFDYEDDFQRLVSVRTTQGALVDLPAVGTVFWPGAQVEVETTVWEEDPDEVGAYIPKTITNERSGLFIYVNDDAGQPVLRSAVDAITATRSRMVDTSQTSAQRYDSRLLRRTEKHYKPIGEDTLTVLVTDYDALRGTVHSSHGGQVIQRASVRPVPATITEWISDLQNDGEIKEIPLVATVVDSTLIGERMADEIVEALFLRDKQPKAFTATPLVWLEPHKYKHGTAWLVRGNEETEEDGGETGVAVITGITYEFSLEDGLVANQTLELMRPEGIPK